MTQAEVEQKYECERKIQLETRGKVSDLEITANEHAKDKFGQDPWLQEYERGRTDYAAREEQRHHKVLILGAGYGGLLFAVRLIQTGLFTADDILMVDEAGGFGGTWYWNRYPGVRCDVESYIYMPLLEETEYMPREKYASGAELRMYAELIAQTWGLSKRALFRTVLHTLGWDDDQNYWTASGRCLLDEPSQPDTPLRLNADFVILAGGIFTNPKIPNFTNIMDYEGEMFHVSRWDYQSTGGSQQDPSLSRLANKKVGIIGTGATAVQAIPFLAKYSKQLTVFQRTPSAVDRRDNRPTDPAWWRKMTLSEGKGWQRQRMENFNAFTCHEQPPPEVNMVGDRWTNMASFSVLIGSKHNRDSNYLDQMKEIDFARQERIRARVRDNVQDKNTANALVPWYPGWCKRPCFHDDYLSAFNRRNVRMVDIRQRGICHFTKKGIVANETEYDLDIIVFSTGYRTTRMCPAERANISVTGRNGQEMGAKWKDGLATLHGAMTRDFPNLFFTGTSQAGVCANQTYVLDQLSIHVAYILAEAAAQNATVAKDRMPELVIEPTAEAEQDWAMQVLSRIGSSPLSQCTPGHYNHDGATERIRSLPLRDKMKAARLATWGEGVASYIQRLEDWRLTDKLHGLEVKLL
ncbi:FAD/NAD(P)-binding domain-containing protein [Aspergillus bertholletiae]|uniref:FAD/NAD(P)-binding domain-containing protein n=1 Tax=Aspergillus bertholletiae TaxID=1226010 RepID=A0A5N7ARM5_9EURO|nr:FAD/NAD(P)-binding domain-containing protein [Aspergillus bertholletiae]